MVRDRFASNQIWIPGFSGSENPNPLSKLRYLSVSTRLWGEVGIWLGEELKSPGSMRTGESGAGEEGDEICLE